MRFKLLICFALSFLLVNSPRATAAHPPQAPAPLTNPLTSFPITDAAFNRRPLVVKVSNHASIIRPQSGLAFADHVWEHQLEGFQFTRYTAIFYSNTPKRVGSVRSTRLIDVDYLVPMYDGILVTSGGSTNHNVEGTAPRIEERLKSAAWARRVVSESYIGDKAYSAPYLQRLAGIPYPSVPDYHRLFAFPTAIWKFMAQRGENTAPRLTSLAFTFTVPAGGKAVHSVSLDFPGKGPRHVWTYVPTVNLWLSATEDQLSRRPRLITDTDLLNGQIMYFDNVVLLYAEHYEADFLEDEPNELLSVGVNLMGRGRAVLLRDGQRFEGQWYHAHANDLLQVYDLQGRPLAYKPGRIWYTVLATNFPTAEVIFK